MSTNICQFITFSTVVSILLLANSVALKENQKRIITTISFHGKIKKNPLQQTNAASAAHCVHRCVKHNECDASVFKADNHLLGICILYDSIMQNDIEINKTSDEQSEVTVYLQAPRSCKEVYEANPNSQNGIYNLRGIGIHYCKMSTSHCSKRGWTLALKIDGGKEAFLYSSKFWTNTSTYNEEKCLKNIDSREEGKFQAFMSLAFEKICLEMKQGPDVRGIELDVQESSLQVVFKSGIYIQTNAGRNAWASLVSNLHLQGSCNREGFNNEANKLQVRLGILANNEHDCVSTDSTVGIGLFYTGCTGSVYSSGNMHDCHGNAYQAATISMLFVW